MQNALNFLPRLTFRRMAADAYRLNLTHAIRQTRKTVNGVVYAITVDSELGAVFIDFNAPNGDAKASVHEIRKSWGF